MSETNDSVAVRGRRRIREGVVASDRPNKTIKVVAEWRRKHPKYGKYIRRRTILHAHDENNDAKIGDRVRLMECRPLSKTKNWLLVSVLERGPES